VSAPGFEIRDVRTLEEGHQAEEIQRAAWGFADKEIVPQNTLLAVRSAGGIVTGAFLRDGTMAGFLFSFAAMRDGEVYHHSHMAAVHPAHQGLGVAYALKMDQRRRVLDLGLDRIVWTFDPLESRNGALNLRKLGVVAHEYKEDIYGLSSGPVHGGMATDRVTARWDLNAEGVRRRAEEGPPRMEPPPGDVAQVNRVDTDAKGRRVPIGWDWGCLGDPMLVEIPWNIAGLKRDARMIARDWRMHIREGLRRLLGEGYEIIDFFVDGDGDPRSLYLLRRSGES
jgi:predicted GNAT superfamily acetyltransferase